MMRALLLSLMLAVACGDSSVDPSTLPVNEAGPFNVGFRSWDVTYTPQGVSDARTIKIHLWYPTNDLDGNNPAYENIFRDDDVFEDAVPAAPIHDGGYPVLVHSHGHRGFAGNSSDIMRYVASHGWVVIAPNHTDNTLFDDAERSTSHYYVRSMDISRALDELASVELAGPIAADRAVLSGHSFGSFTTWASAGATFDASVMGPLCEADEVGADACSEGDLQIFLDGLGDDRVVAGIPMAGGDRGWFGTGGYDAVDVPILLMTGSDDDVGAAGLFDLVSDVELTWVDVDGGCHQLFGLGGCDLISDDEGYPIVNTYVLAWARRWLLDDSAEDVVGVVDGTLDVSSRVTLQRK